MNASAMWHCAQCNAPNPASRETCYACGRVCDAARPEPSPDLLSPQMRVHDNAGLPSGPAPNGWTITSITGDSVTLRRNFSGRVARDPAAVVALGAAVFCAVNLFPTFRPGQSTSSQNRDIVALILGALVFLAMIAWIVFIQEDLSAGPGRIALVKGAGAKTWTKAATGTPGFLVIETRESWTRNGRAITRILRAEAGGQRWTLDSRTKHPGWLEGLFGDQRSGIPNDDTTKLARFLAERTGWTILDRGISSQPFQTW